MNFNRTNTVIANVESNLQEAFHGQNENRILDIWIDLPEQIVNHFVNQHFEKIDKDLRRFDHAMKTTEKLA